MADRSKRAVGPVGAGCLGLLGFLFLGALLTQCVSDAVTQANRPPPAQPIGAADAAPACGIAKVYGETRFPEIKRAVLGEGGAKVIRPGPPMRVACFYYGKGVATALVVEVACRPLSNEGCLRIVGAMDKELRMYAAPGARVTPARAAKGG